MKYFIFIIFLILISSSYAQHFTPPDLLNYSLIEDSEGGAIYSKHLNEAVNLILQVIDMRKSKVDLIVGDIIRSGDDDGIHYPHNKRNPWLAKMDFDSAFNTYKESYGNDVISFTNAVFFETIGESLYTPLAYPLKFKGEIISSGDSPYAPNTGNYPLKILSIENSSIIISNYNYENGEPLSDKNKLNQFVTLNYRHHPRVIEFSDIKEGKSARFHLITAINKYDGAGNETVFIISSTSEISIFHLAYELKKLSNKIIDDEILTLDGGSSISVQGKNGDDIIKPLNNVKVPVYLGFRLKK